MKKRYLFVVLCISGVATNVSASGVLPVDQIDVKASQSCSGGSCPSDSIGAALPTYVRQGFVYEKVRQMDEAEEINKILTNQKFDLLMKKTDLLMRMTIMLWV